jgi:hypothetical protein
MAGASSNGLIVGFAESALMTAEYKERFLSCPVCNRADMLFFLQTVVLAS